MITLSIDAARVQRELAALAAFTTPGSRGITRRLPSPAYREARAWLATLMADAGLAVRVDPAGNLIGRRDGGDAAGPVLLVGSHSDTVIDGGAYDGALGVLGAVEAARALRAAGIALRHPLEVVDFLSEEVSDFGPSAIGSRAMAGTLQVEWVARRSPAGVSLGEAMREMGGIPERVKEAARPRGHLAAYLELHIEQGPQLERSGVQVGVVQGIAGIRRYQATVEGQPDHAGTTPMDMRKDALAGAAEIVLMIERLCRIAGSPMVGTVGQMTLAPNVSNVIPGLAELTFEVRGPDEERIAPLCQSILEEAAALAEARGLTWRCESSGFVPPVAAAPLIVNAIEEVSRRRGYSTMRLYSGAGHDGSHIAGIAP
ncbi:MAG: Zn-dependent hydrolase, partial [Armatimonadetes bacterium]|nr:Zn-dependent hydrolase [Armatimonadota bacterium]